MVSSAIKFSVLMATVSAFAAALSDSATSGSFDVLQQIHFATEGRTP